MITEEEFFEKCKAHDLTYSYADDLRVVRRGEASEIALRALAEELPAGKGAEIFNRVVDQKIAEPHRDQFYWPATA